jgi:hypothetical protein
MNLKTRIDRLEASIPMPWSGKPRVILILPYNGRDPAPGDYPIGNGGLMRIVCIGDGDQVDEPSIASQSP